MWKWGKNLDCGFALGPFWWVEQMIEQDLDSLLQKDNRRPAHGASYFLWGREQMRMCVLRCGEEKGWLNVLSLLLNSQPHVLHLVMGLELSLAAVSPRKEETGEKEACPLEQGWPAFCRRVWGPPLIGGSLWCHDYSPGLRILIRVYIWARPLLVVLTSKWGPGLDQVLSTCGFGHSFEPPPSSS